MLKKKIEIFQISLKIFERHFLMKKFYNINLRNILNLIKIFENYS